MHQCRLQNPAHILLAGEGGWARARTDELSIVSALEEPNVHRRRQIRETNAHIT